MIRWLVLFLVFAGPATAQETSLRPVARPEQQVAEPEADENTASDSAVATSLRPQPRTAAVAQAAETARVARVKGQICGDPDLQGDVLGTVAGRGACGVENAVRVKSVAGIRFPANPTMNCRLRLRSKSGCSAARSRRSVVRAAVFDPSEPRRITPAETATINRVKSCLNTLRAARLT